jgi:hypothetical protein
MADSAVATLDSGTLGGTMVVGIYGGIEGDRYPRLVVKCPDRRTGQLFRREISFRGFNPATGEATSLGLELQRVAVGDLVAVGVFLNPKKANYARDTEKHNKGDEFLLVEFDAMWVESLSGK